ncbi:RNA polymerase factor sigma-54 [Pseudoflavonifractor phocaeensis]|uniref:RNA polymerase factor sigma-54 n=1 Tax=Pseudoflavonifractor phocaeensis TaxID=1870988 RepID=UPI001F31DA27|nr:RNA polymerase factor sigma-54 [Pseudoflavonifractor phocaeensis]MCF2595810.1 RNA polymerase factor sigma-54 [Pseudoflavonifractor phocaeensis]
MELIQSQVQRLSQQQLQGVELLQMSAQELESYLRELSQENPVVELEEHFAPAQESPREEDLLRRLRWLEDNDRQNHYYQHIDEEELDPLVRVSGTGGLEETLVRFISRQLDRLGVEEELDRAVRYLAACLDGGGYLRFSLEELSGQTGIPLSRMKRALALLHSLEPAGVGAADLSQCLELQLLRIGAEGPALAIVRDHLEALAKRHYRAIASALGITVEQVREAEGIIRELEPRPGAVFEQPEQVAYIQPDVFVAEEEGRFVARTRGGERPPFRISAYYRDLLSQSGEQEVREYLTGKLRQAEGVLWAIGQRERTLLRCAQAITERQQDFFRLGPQALVPLRMADVAQELGVHESTVSRSIREKYLQCARGVYPMSYFFSRSATADQSGAAVGGTAARALLKQLLDQEDKSRPLSDQKLSEEMERQGCPISRRTVAKYREKMNIPGASGRKR